MKRPKFERRLQKALNHLNKAIVRLDQLDEMEEPVIALHATDTPRTVWWFLSEEVGGLRRRVLWAATLRGIELDEEGMPR